jgi:hypothetical protein
MEQFKVAVIDILQAPSFALSTDLLIRPVDELVIDGLSCEDCPDINPQPPEQSECEYFDATVCPAICTREDSLGKQVIGFLTSQQ